ncbi:MAG: hypothetical protein U0X41_12625 [Chitinophagales bacterium]
MQKYSFITFACCLMLAFTACKKEALLETNQDLNPTKNLIVKPSTAAVLHEVSQAEFDELDSISLSGLLLKPNKNIASENATACFGPITGICGAPLIYNDCYYKYQIWNSPDFLYVDLYFPSSVIGWKRDCNGRTCQYYITPCISLDLYNAAGGKIGSVNVASSNITVTETRVTYNLASLKAQYPALACVKLSGQFFVMKKCGSCSITRVSTVCITQKQFCLQQCPSVCPSVDAITLDKNKLCGSGTVNTAVAVSGDAAKVSVVWSVDGQNFKGRTAAISFPVNNTCAVITKTIHVKVVCNADQTVLAENDLVVTINPVLSAVVNVDNYSCQAIIEPVCQSDVAVSWTFGTDSGTGNTVQLSSQPQNINYTISSNGCSYNAVEEGVYCLPLFKNTTITRQ